MTFPIIDMLLLITEESSQEQPSKLLIAVICTAVFIAASVISGIVSFRIRSGKLRKERRHDENLPENEK